MGPAGDVSPPAVTIESVVSTFLVCLGVVAVAIGVLRIALSDPDQPATVRRDTGGGRRRRAQTRERRSPLAGTAPPPTPMGRAGLRLRSGLALVVLVVCVGVTVAAIIGAGLALAARALTDAIG